MTGELAEAVVDLAAVAGNVERIAGATTAAVMAAVKADGFGHGALPVARAALAAADQVIMTKRVPAASRRGLTDAVTVLEVRH